MICENFSLVCHRDKAQKKLYQRRIDYKDKLSLDFTLFFQPSCSQLSKLSSKAVPCYNQWPQWTEIIDSVHVGLWCVCKKNQFHFVGILATKFVLVNNQQNVKTKVRNIWFLSPLVPSKREKNIQTEPNLRQLSLSQFVYFLREVCLLFNF